MHKQEDVLENEMNNFLGDFGMQTDDPTQARKSDLFLDTNEWPDTGQKIGPSFS